MSEQPPRLNDDLDPELIDRYWSGQLDDASRRIAEQWFAAHPGQRARYAKIRQGIATGGHAPMPGEELRRRTQEVFKAARVATPPLRAVSVPQSKSRSKAVVTPRYALAVTGIAALFLGGFLWTTLEPGGNLDASQERRYQTAAGQRAVIDLPGGSTIALAPATTVLVVGTEASGFDVNLDGEAYFEIIHADRVPFRVRTENAEARVLGTSFVVRKYATDRVSQVVVEEGRVAVTSHTASDARASQTILSASMLATVDDSGSVTTMQTVQSAEYSAWREGRLVFRKAPVREIVAELRRAYGADIALTDSVMAERELTWTVSTDQLSLRSALDALATVLGAHLQISDSTVTLVPGRKVPREYRERHPVTLPERIYGR